MITPDQLHNIVSGSRLKLRLTGFEAISVSGAGAFYLETTDGDRLLIKVQRREKAAQLISESKGLSLLTKDSSGPVVPLLDHGEQMGFYYLITPWIDSDHSEAGFEFGEALAIMHAERTASSFGLEYDNFLGLSPQLNTQKTNWTDFFNECRLGYQKECAVINGYCDIADKVDKLTLKLADILPERPKASLLHGDLWAGNFLTDSDGNQLMIDPSVYYGDREAEFGIITIFGGFDQEFYDGYNGVSPFEQGFEDRLPIYQLYHYLNHLNIFGSSYATACHAILDSYL